MAVKEVNIVKTTDANTISPVVAFEAATTVADGFLVPYDGKDFKTCVLVNNTGAAAGTVTVKGGEGFRKAEDLVLAVPVGYTFFTVDSAYYKNADGEIQIIGSAATIEIAVIEAR
ncbi:MAG: hypothetical protein GX025_10980 [Clostridiales bacterium]|nr:hypothetical protein [Clostridiales bacterium]